ncbi:MAG: hypothetical protein QXQ60_09295, partial [Thermofilum sp.]
RETTHYNQRCKQHSNNFSLPPHPAATSSRRLLKAVTVINPAILNYYRAGSGLGSIKILKDQPIAKRGCSGEDLR